MTLFFETSSQACCFAALLPLGFLLAMCLCIRIEHSALRLAADLAAFASAACALAMFLLFSREPVLRLYHALGLLAGAVLYLEGAGKVGRRFFQQAGKMERMTKR